MSVLTPTSSTTPPPVQTAVPPVPTLGSNNNQNGNPGTPPNTPSFVPGTPNFEHIRLQQLYTLAIADRMRFFNPLWNTPRPIPPPPQDTFYKGLDPRFFGRGPEEPKPQQSYIGLIALAILSNPDQKLVLADIYQYILDNFAYFRHRGPGWRNSIRHNLSLNDCFIKAGRAANGKGHYWAIHTACIEDFKKGDFRRRKAQRKVRRHMGLAVDEEDSPSPPPPPPQGLFAPHGWPPLPLRLPPPLPTQLPLQPSPHLPQIPNIVTPVAATSVTTPIRVKRQFDVASLLASDSSSKKEADNEDNESWRSASPPNSQTVVQPGNPASLLPHQYLARYYQLVQQHQQQQNSASAAAAALAAAAAAAASNQHHNPEVSSPRGSPNSPLPERNF